MERVNFDNNSNRALSSPCGCLAVGNLFQRRTRTGVHKYITSLLCAEPPQQQTWLAFITRCVSLKTLAACVGAPWALIPVGNKI
jgi:hypothetical protein